MKQKRLATLALALFALLVTAGLLYAAPNALEMVWWTVDGGGGTLSNGSYSLSGTVGQAEVGAALESGGYTLVGGYWYGAGEEVQRHELYLPSVIR
jgi:hypothetical protein